MIGRARASEFRIDTSESIISEVIAVLRDDFHWESYRLHDARQCITAMCNTVTPVQTLQVVVDDPDDDRILECAAGSDCIVTQDEDLLRLKEFEGIGIITPTQFLDWALGR